MYVRLLYTYFRWAFVLRFRVWQSGSKVMYTGSEIKAYLRFLQAVRYGIGSPWYRTGLPPYPSMSDVTYKRNIVLIASVQMTSITGSTHTSYPPFSLPPLACLSWRILLTLLINLGPCIHNSVWQIYLLQTPTEITCTADVHLLRSNYRGTVNELLLYGLDTCWHQSI